MADRRVILHILFAFFILTAAVGILTPKEAEQLIQESTVILSEEAAVEIKEETEQPNFYAVTRIIDGDTIVVEMNGRPETVRLIGIDTPETVHPTKPVSCLGLEAARKTKELLEGREVSLQYDMGEGTRDKYQRLLAYVFRDDGLFINRELIEAGYAYEYTYDLPYQYQVEFKDAEERARLNARGLWGHNADSLITC